MRLADRAIGSGSAARVGIALLAAALCGLTSACTGYIPQRGETGGTAAVYNPPAELPPLSEEDSIAVRRRVGNALFLYYHNIRRGGSSSACRAERGEFCLRGDWDTSPCPTGSRAFCTNDEEEHADRDALAAVLDSAVAVLPGDPWVLGLQVYQRTKFRRFGPAQAALTRCAGEPWYCAGLRGWFYHETDQLARADSAYGDMLETMPAELRCEWTDLRDVYRWRIGGEYGGLSCEERQALNERIWWLADPLWIVEGNDRLTEHFTRQFGAVLHDDLLRTAASSHPRSHHRVVIPRGFEDSICMSGAPYPSNRYSFLPDWRAVRDPLSADSDDWELLVEDYYDRVEGYTPPFGFFFTELDAQVAYFRRGAGARVVVVSEVGLNGNLVDYEYGAGVWIGTGPDQAAYRRYDERKRHAYTFLADIPARAHLFGVEAYAPEQGAGRVRFGQAPPFDPDSPRGMSDLLLIRPGASDPTSLEEIALAAYGRRYVTTAEPLALFWELYGAERSEPVSYVLVLDREGGGFLGFGGFDPVRVAWTAPAEPTEDGRWMNVQTLGIRDLSPGQYTLRLSASIGGLVPEIVTRSFEVIDPPEWEVVSFGEDTPPDPLIGTMGARKDREYLPCIYVEDTIPWSP